MSQKSEIYIDTNFRPLSFNVRKALDVVKKFEMAWPDAQGNLEAVKNPFEPQAGVKELKPLTAGDRLGLYKMPTMEAPADTLSPTLKRPATGLLQ